MHASSYILASSWGHFQDETTEAQRLSDKGWSWDLKQDLSDCAAHEVVTQLQHTSAQEQGIGDKHRVPAGLGAHVEKH